MKPTLFLLAAGMGSRYGGLKTIQFTMPFTQASASWYSLSARILKKISAASSFQSTKATFLANSYSRASMHCPKVSPVLQSVQSLGVLTTP